MAKKPEWGDTGRLRLTDYIDKEGNLRVCLGHPSTASQKIQEIVGTRPVWSEKYETIGGYRTWGEAREGLGVQVDELDNTVN